MLFYKMRLIFSVSYELGTSFASKSLYKLDVRAPWQCLSIKIKCSNLIKIILSYVFCPPPPPIQEINKRPFPSSLVPLFQSESKCEMTDLHENESACRTHFHMNGFALRLVLKQRHKRTRKWPINNMLTCVGCVLHQFVTWPAPCLP